MQCELCGTDENLVCAEIEGSKLNVCNKCAKHGRIIGVVKEEVKTTKKTEKKKVEEAPERDVIHIIVPDFPKKLREKRERMGMKQEDFAKLISEKESVVHKMETGEFTPSIQTAMKLERILGVKLIEEYEEKHEKKGGVRAEGVTIGDVVKIRKR